MRTAVNQYATPARHAAMFIDLTKSGPDPDAELIQLCTDYQRAVEHYNAVCEAEAPRGPAFEDMMDLEARILDIDAQTLQGIVAKARIALFLAQMPDGSLNFDEEAVTDFPEQVIRDLLRVCGEMVS